MPKTIKLDPLLEELKGKYVFVRCTNGVVAKGTITAINGMGIKIVNNNSIAFIPFYNIIAIEYNLKTPKDDKLK